MAPPFKSKSTQSHPQATGSATTATSSSSQSPATRPLILLISLNAEVSTGLVGIDQQLCSALDKHAETIQSVTTQATLKHLSANPKPTACLITHPSITEDGKVIGKLKEYVTNGGRMIVGFSEFLNRLTLPQFAPFFRHWDLPWEVGAYHRSTFALNPAGIPHPLRPKKLFEAYSMKSTSLKNVQPKDKVYLPVSTSRVEDRSGNLGEPLTGALLNECPAAWTRVGQGYLGYVGDVNDEEESTRLVLEMCGITIAPGDLGPRECAVGLNIQPGRPTEAIMETCAERQLMVRTKKNYPPLRAREDEVAARAVKRANFSRQKRLVAESRKEAGNQYFKQGKFGEAASRYRQAILAYGPRPIYLTNLAAALLKTRRYKAAYEAARRALSYDAKNVKALYRSGMALKEQGLYDAAVEEFKGVLRQDPSNAAALAAFSETIKLTNDRAPKGLELLKHNEGNALWDIMTDSDSSEYEHEGNGRPCRYLNGDGCRHGSHCRFKHAPDEKSVRDQLGRNVCIAWLLGMCYHDKKCYYAHDRAYLPHGGWWSNQNMVRSLREELEICLMWSTNKRYDTDIFFMTLWVQNRWHADEWMFGKFSALDDEVVPTGGPQDCIVVNTTQRDGQYQCEYTMRPGSGARAQASGSGAHAAGGDDEDDDGDYSDKNDLVGDDDEDYWDDEDDDGGSLDADSEIEDSERSRNLGFSDDEVNELLCQGVKPWDDDAWDVLRVLRGM